MKNNSLAMLATISLVLSLASLIGYIDPAVCAMPKTAGYLTCEQSAHEHVLAFWGFAAFGIITLVTGTLRARLAKAKQTNSLAD